MNICEKELCSGCSACRDSCPRNCITMEEDDYGVIYPKIDESKCVKCNLCKSICPSINPINLNNPEECYAAYQTDYETRKNSASGGVAAALYKIFINTFSGRIYGVCSENNNVCFKSGNSEEDIEQFKGSQYTQADMEFVYKSIEQDMVRGYSVLFIGCPCQVAGCISYVLKKKLNIEKLFTVDLLCHGVVPQKYLREELSYLSNKFNWSEFSKVTFRTNIPGANYHFSLQYKGDHNTIGEYRNPAIFSPYFSSFIFNTSLRTSCYNCKYSTLRRTGDLTIGDFIGLGKKSCYPEYKYKTTNTSVILVNTQKGKLLCRSLDSELFMIERPIEEAFTAAPSMNGPAKPSRYRKKFLKLYPKHGFRRACVKSQSLLFIKENTKYIIKKIIKKV